MATQCVMEAEGGLQISLTETKCATSFWSEYDLNHYSYETSVETKLGIETSNYSGCQF